MAWYRIRVENEQEARNVTKALTSQNYKVWRYGSTKYRALITLVGNGHDTWLGRLCADYHCKAVAIPKPPKSIARQPSYQNMPPIIEPYRPTRPTDPSEPKQDKAVVVAQIEPQQALSFGGVVASLEAYRDRLWTKVEQLDTLITGLKGWQENEEELKRLEGEFHKRVSAVKLVVGNLLDRE